MQNYTYTTNSVHFIWCCIQVRGGERGLERVKWGRRAVPLRGDQPPTYNPWWARWGLGLCRWAGGGEGTIPFKFNLCWCAASGAACCDCHFARWRKMENSRTKIQTTRQLTWKLDWERSKLFSELDLYEVHFFAPQGIVAWQYASRFFRRIPVKRFFPPCFEWVMTNTIDIIVEFLKKLHQFSKTATFSSTLNIELVLSLASSPSTSQLRDCGANCTFSEQTRLPFLAACAGGQRCKSAR